jgi:asparagine synthase (glutamine-hydrolysing)
MHDRENGNVIVFNGEIYNFAELRAELKNQHPGYAFGSGSDTEVLLRGYAAWGTAMFARLDGMFALVLFDSANRKLVIARDHVGIKPLYYTQIDRGGWAFCSEVRGLIAAGVAAPRIDPEGLASFLRFGAVAEPRTFCAGVSSFPPGCWAELSLDGDGTLKPVVYWSPDRFITGLGDPDEHGAVLRRTVGEQLVADVPVGLFLSAGLDSTALAVLASTLAPGRIKAFTISSGRGADDEAEIAGATARVLQMPHEVEALATARATAWAFDSLNAMDQPSADGTNTYLVSRASREHGMIAALAGTGADETHGGYGQFQTIPRWRNPLLGAVANWFGAPVLSMLGRRVEAERLKLMMSCAPSTRAMLAEKRRYFTPSWIAGYAPAWLPRQEGRGPLVADAFADPRDEIVLGELGGYLRNTLLKDCDWATMSNSQELRVPYLGRRYLEYVLALPWAAKGRRRKGPNKPLIAATIPASLQAVCRRPKTGFVVDVSSMLLGSHRDAFIRASASLNGVGFSLDGRRLLAELSRSHSRKEAHRLWALLALGNYIEQHNMGL